MINLSAPIFLLEGADGVGKTTLCRSIASMSLGAVTSIYSGPPPDDEPAVMHYWDRVTFAAKASEAGSTVIIDRLHVGELVYGPILRGESGMTVDECYLIDMKLMALASTMIHCYLPYHEMIKRLIMRDGGKPDEKSGASVGHAYALRVGFIGLLGRTNESGRMPASWEVTDMSTYPDQIAERLHVQATLKARSRMPDGWIGSPFPHNVIVLPSSEYWDDIEVLSSLVRHLRLCGATKNTAIICPTASVMENEYTSKVAMEEANVIALGTSSSKWIETAFGVIPNRCISFMDGDEDEWTEALRSCLYS